MTNPLEVQFLQALRSKAHVPAPLSKRGLQVGPKKYGLKELDGLADTLLAGSLTANLQKTGMAPDAMRGKVQEAMKVFYRNDRHFSDDDVLAGAVLDRLADEKRVEDVAWSGDPDKSKTMGADEVATHPETGGHPEHGRFVAALSGFMAEADVEELWQLTVQGVDWASRPGLAREEKKQNPYYPQIAERFKSALVVRQGERLALWSGGYDVSMYAQDRGFNTLEVTRAGKVYDQLKLFKNFSPLGELWNQISREFVVHAQAEVHVFLRSFDQSSVLMREELPTILKLEEVTDIRWHLLVGKNLKELSEVDAAGRRVTAHTFSSYGEVVALMESGAIRYDDVTKNRDDKNLSEYEQRDIKETVAQDQQRHDGVEAMFRKETEAKAAGFELDRSHNDDAGELQEKKAGVDAIVNPIAVRLRNGLRYDDSIRDDVDRKLAALARAMDAKYPRASAVRELQVHARQAFGDYNEEDAASAVAAALAKLKEGGSLDEAKWVITQRRATL